MSKLLFIGDLHLGHQKAIQFRKGFGTIEEHDDLICTNWNKKVEKNDLVYVLGDVSFTTAGLERIGALKGRKFLIRGNHDVFNANRYLLFFEDIAGLTYKKYKGTRYWLSHCPIHPDELRGGKNIHGHVHTNTIPDQRYFNVSAEMVDYTPQTIEELEERNAKLTRMGVKP